MIAIRMDTQLNLLCMTFVGRVLAGELDGRTAKIEAALRDLRPGFRVVTDLSELEEMRWECAREIQKMMTRYAEAGVGEVIRVIPDPSRDIGFGIMSAFHYSSKVVIQTFQNRREALSHLGWEQLESLLCQVPGAS